MKAKAKLHCVLVSQKPVPATAPVGCDSSALVGRILPTTWAADGHRGWLWRVRTTFWGIRPFRLRGAGSGGIDGVGSLLSRASRPGLAEMREDAGFSDSTSDELSAARRRLPVVYLAQHSVRLIVATAVVMLLSQVGISSMTEASTHPIGARTGNTALVQGAEKDSGCKSAPPAQPQRQPQPLPAPPPAQMLNSSSPVLSVISTNPRRLVTWYRHKHLSTGIQQM